jgi:hypothetical protein
LVNEVSVLNETVSLASGSEDPGNSLVSSHRAEEPRRLTVDHQRFERDREVEVRGRRNSRTSHCVFCLSVEPSDPRQLRVSRG